MTTQDPTRDRPDARLTQAEMDAIADVLREGLAERADEAAASSQRLRDEPIVLRYDLIGRSERHMEDLPGLQLVHERFVTELARELGRTIGTGGTLAPAGIGRRRFGEIMAECPTPVALVSTEFVGAGCTLLIIMDPGFVLHVIDLLMGGDGGAAVDRPDLPTRGFTAAEEGLIGHLIATMNRAFAAAWRDVEAVNLQMTRVATDPRHLMLFDPAEAMVELIVDVQWRDVSGPFRLVFPASCLAQFADGLQAPGRQRGSGRDERDGIARGLPSPASTRPGTRVTEMASPEAMRAHLLRVPVELEAQLGTAEMPLERLLSLAVGDIVRLDTDPGEPILMTIDSMPFLRALPTSHRGHVAVAVTGFIADEVAAEVADAGAAYEERNDV